MLTLELEGALAGWEASGLEDVSVLVVREELFALGTRDFHLAHDPVEQVTLVGRGQDRQVAVKGFRNLTAHVGRGHDVGGVVAGGV